MSTIGELPRSARPRLARTSAVSVSTPATAAISPRPTASVADTGPAGGAGALGLNPLLSVEVGTSSCYTYAICGRTGLARTFLATPERRADESVRSHAAAALLDGFAQPSLVMRSCPYL